MKAAVLHELKKPMAIEEVQTPKPGEGEVLIKVEACGVCHSDLHVAEGDWKQFGGITKLPLIVGHEVAGKVVEVGSGVSALKVGDRVGVPWIFWTCGECEFCREGNENLCVKQKITGVTVDGGYAEFIKAPATHATKIPDSVSSVQAAPLFCAGVTVYRAIMQAKPQRGQRLAVFGVGGLGHLAIQIGVHLGLEVSAVDVADDKLALAKSLGAANTFNAASFQCRERNAPSRQRSHCPGYFRIQSCVRHGVLLRATHRHFACRRPAVGRNFFSRHHDGRRRGQHQSIRCRHAQRPGACSGSGG